MKVFKKPTIRMNETELYPEVKLLLYCARIELDAETLNRVNILLSGDIDWEYLLLIASDHRLLPLLYKNLKKYFKRIVPSNILYKLKDIYRKNSMRNVYMSSELITIIDIFNDNNILSIPFKGPLIATMAYKSTSYKSFYDLDMLVHEQDFLKAIEILSQYEYKPHHEFKKHTINRRRACTLYNKQKGISLDIHRTIVWPCVGKVIDYEKCWHNLMDINLLNTNIKSLSVEYTIIFLAIQISKDYLSNTLCLAKICDMNELILRHPELDWELVWKEFNIWGNQRIIIFSILLLEILFNLKAPILFSSKKVSYKNMSSLVNQAVLCIIKDTSCGSFELFKKSSFSILFMDNGRVISPFFDDLLQIQKLSGLLLVKIFGQSI